MPPVYTAAPPDCRACALLAGLSFAQPKGGLRAAGVEQRPEQHIGGEPPMSGGGSAAGSQAQRAKPSAAAVSQLAQRGEPSWPAVGDEVEADWSGEGEWFDGRVTQARADGTARLSAKAAKAAQEAEAQNASGESSDLSIDEDEDEAGAVRKPNWKRKPRVECEAAAAGEEQEEEQVRTYVRVS